MGWVRLFAKLCIWFLALVGCVTLLAGASYVVLEESRDDSMDASTPNTTPNPISTSSPQQETPTQTPVENTSTPHLTQTPKETKKKYYERTKKEWDREFRDENDPGNQTVNVTNTTVTSNGTENKTIYFINKYRSENGLNNWTYSYALASTSRAHSKDMYERDFFSHENPDGELPWERWGKEECRRKYGENLYRTYINVDVQDSNGNINKHTTETDIAKHTLYSWQNSTEHNELLLTNDSSIAGVGAYIDSYNAESDSYVVHVTLNTCEPSSQNE